MLLEDAYKLDANGDGCEVVDAEAGLLDAPVETVRSVEAAVAAARASAAPAAVASAVASAPAAVPTTGAPVAAAAPAAAATLTGLWIISR